MARGANHNSMEYQRTSQEAPGSLRKSLLFACVRMIAETSLSAHWNCSTFAPHYNTTTRNLSWQTFYSCFGAWMIGAWRASIDRAPAESPSADDGRQMKIEKKELLFNTLQPEMVPFAQYDEI